MLINKPKQPHAAAESVVSADAESRSRNDRQSYISTARTLAKAQFVLADAELSRGLWPEVADRDLEVGRLLHLLYGGWVISGMLYFLPISETSLIGKTLKYGLGNVSP